MQAALDAPIGPVCSKPLRGIQSIGSATGHQPDGFRFVFSNAPIELRHLFHVREAYLLRCCRLGLDLSTLASRPVLLLTPAHSLGDLPRGKRPPEWRRIKFLRFV